MADLADYGIDRDTLHRMSDEWKGGVPKSTFEARYLDQTSPHGKVFSALVREHLGIESEDRSGLADENRRLRALLRARGIDLETGRSSGEPESWRAPSLRDRGSRIRRSTAIDCAERSVRLAKGMWNGMRDQATLEKFLDVSPGLFKVAREKRVLVSHWSPSGEAYCADEDVAGFDEFLAQMREERRSRPRGEDQAPGTYVSRGGGKVRVVLCQSCDQAIASLGHCGGCS